MHPIVIDKNQISKVLIITLIIIFAIKLPFVFHGNWDGLTFVPYMTDETIVCAPIYSYFSSGNYDIKYMLQGYTPFLFNILFPFLYVIVKLISIFKNEIDSVALYEIIYYPSRILVLLCATVGSFFYVKLFEEIIKSKFYQVLLLVLVNFNSLFFLYSRYVKTDEIIWALGSISMFYGLMYWKHGTFKNYIKFYLFSILTLCANFHGFIYFFHCVLVSFIPHENTSVKNSTKFILLFFLAPLIFVIANFEILYNFEIFFIPMVRTLGYSLSFLNKYDMANTERIPFLEGTNGYSSFQFYVDYLKYHLITPVFVLLALAVYILKSPSNYYRLVGGLFTIFYLYISFATYRTDRLFIPIHAFAIFLMVYFFTFCHETIRNCKLKLLVFAVAIIFTLSTLNETVILATSLLGKDTRYIFYERAKSNLPRRSEITFINVSISGAYAASYPLKTNNSRKDFQIKEVWLDSKTMEYELLSTLKGYFVVSAVDFDILKAFKNTKYYSKQYNALEKLVSRSHITDDIDKINYPKQPFGPTWMIPNSLYGLHNPKIIVYKTNNSPNEISKKIVNDVPFDIDNGETYKNVNIDFNNLIVKIDTKKGNYNEYNCTDYENSSWFDIKLRNGTIKKVLEIANKTNFNIELHLKYLGKNSEGIDLGYGFADSKFAGRKFVFSTWIKANKKDCVSLGFYRGNIRTIGWGDTNELDGTGSKYEYLYCEAEFDQPYSLNGNIIYEIKPGSTVKLTNPKFEIF